MGKNKKPKINTYFKITPPNGRGLAWAQRYWDTFGFDYDMERCEPVILAWAYTVTDDQLKAALDEARITYSTFQATAESLFS